MRMKKCLSILLAVVMIATMITSLPITANAVEIEAATTADSTVKTAGTVDELNAVCSEINTNGGEYVINLTDDISGGSIEIKNADAVVTIYGNSHTIDRSQGYSAINVVNGATVNLGSADGGDKNILTIVGGTDDSEPGIVHVWPNSTCNMYDNVTLKDHKGANYLGGGVTVQGGTFIMNGGTIENCGIDGGSVCYGGGVAVISNGTFIMDGGTITDCYATSNYPAQDNSRQYTAIGGGVFVTAGSEFTMNGGTISNCEATNFGGGVALVMLRTDLTTNEYVQKGMGSPQSTVTINDGTITGNFADEGAGGFRLGLFLRLCKWRGIFYSGKRKYRSTRFIHQRKYDL